MNIRSTPPCLTADLTFTPDILVFSHLRWQFVTQRPQHLMERLGKHRKVLFVEEPISFDKENYGTAETIIVNDSIRVLQPRIERNNFSELQKIIHAYSHLDSMQPTVWFYSAAFSPILGYLQPSLVVYDCMDELSAFKGASPILMHQEKELLATADIVFTGGKSLYEAKRKLNSHVYCFPSSVDKKHFIQTSLSETPVPQDIANIPQPIVGFYGVIDERIDTALLAKLAKQNHQVSFVMIGPVVKIDPAALPQFPNLYYLGQKSYKQLPNYLKAFRIAMMPFALNAATQFISPTKTLEFMAAQKPIISTPIYDVKRDYAQVVSVVNSAKEFSQAIHYYLHETTSAKQRRLSLQANIIQQTSWNKTAQKMTVLMSQALQAKLLETENVSTLPSQPSLEMQLAAYPTYGIH